MAFSAVPFPQVLRIPSLFLILALLRDSLRCQASSVPRSGSKQTLGVAAIRTQTTDPAPRERMLRYSGRASEQCAEAAPDPNTTYHRNYDTRRPAGVQGGKSPKVDFFGGPPQALECSSKAARRGPRPRAYAAPATKASPVVSARGPRHLEPSPGERQGCCSAGPWGCAETKRRIRGIPY